MTFRGLNPLTAKAFEARDRGDLDEARALLRQAFEEGDAAAANSLGALEMQYGSQEDAERWFGIAAARGDGSAACNLAQIALERGDRGTAVRLLRQAGAGGFGDALILLGKLEGQAGHDSEMAALFRRAADAEVAAGAYFLGLVAINDRRDRAEAEMWFRKTIELGQEGNLVRSDGSLADDGTPALAWCYLGCLAAADGDLAEAERLWERADTCFEEGGAYNRNIGAPVVEMLRQSGSRGSRAAAKLVRKLTTS
jgi:TPR repeat protein